MYIQIPREFKKNGMNYILLFRVENICIYTQFYGDTKVGYEVHRIRKHEGRCISGNEIKPAEYLASNEEFGRFAWFYSSIDDAFTKASELFPELEAGVF